MGEPERRRRRLRPPSAAAAEAAKAAAAEAATPEAAEAKAATREATAATAASEATSARATAPERAAAPEAVAAEAPVRADTAVIETMPVEGPEEGVSARPRPRVPRAPTSGAGYVDDRDVERGLRGLVGSGSSQVSVGAALRARDAARPTETHLAEAERSLAIVRRNWSPPG
jgi:hypothetical protein